MANFGLIPKSKERKIADVLSYPMVPLREVQEPSSVCLPKKLIRSYSQRDTSQISHSVRDRLECKLQEKKQIVTCRKVKRIKKENDMRLCDLEYNPDLDRQADWSLKRLKKTLRGKSADVIKTILLKDVEAPDLTQKFESSLNEELSSSFQNFRSSRRQMHVTMMDERESKILEKDLTEPLDRLKVELRTFGRKETTFNESKRFFTFFSK